MEAQGSAGSAGLMCRCLADQVMIRGHRLAKARKRLEGRTVVHAAAYTVCIVSSRVRRGDSGHIALEGPASVVRAVGGSHALQIYSVFLHLRVWGASPRARLLKERCFSRVMAVLIDEGLEDLQQPSSRCEHSVRTDSLPRNEEG